MGAKDLPDFNDFQAEDGVSRRVGTAETSTETIDVSSLFDHDAYSSGAFSLSGLESAVFGRLLDALPIPALLLDRGYCVRFANRFFKKLAVDDTWASGKLFTDLISRPRDSVRAEALVYKAEFMLERAFLSGKRQIVETILDLGNNARIWARIHLQTVRIIHDKHLLLLTEDVTCERKLERLNQRTDRQLRIANRKLQTRIRTLSEALARTAEELGREVHHHLHTHETLKVEKRKFDVLAKHAGSGVALIDPNGGFSYVNPEFQELFGYDVEDLNSGRRWIRTVGVADGGHHQVLLDWLEKLVETESELRSIDLIITCEDRTEIIVHGLVEKLDDGSFVMILRKSVDASEREAKS
ncbi:MAG: PAS domain-containing protein [Thermodesulfobacteriota bacterium]